MLFLEERVDRFNAQTVVNDFDSRRGLCTAGCEYYSGDFGAFTLKLLSLFNRVWEVSQDVLVVVFDAAEDDLL